MTNGNRWMTLGLLVLAAGAGYLGFRLATGGSPGTHDGPLEISSEHDPLEPPPNPTGDGGGRPIRVMTEGPPGSRPGGPARNKSEALQAYDGDVEARPVTGLVRNEDGDAVPGALVAARLLTTGASRPLIGDVVASTRTDAEGHFEITGFLRLGETYVLDVSHPEYALTRTSPVEPLKPTTTTQNVVLSAGVHVAGTITDQNGTPLSGVELTAYDLELVSLSPDGIVEGSATSDARGRYEIPHLRLGTKRVVARSHGLANAQRSPLRVRASVETLDFRLAVGHHISGSVVDADTGTGIPDVVVRAQPVGSTPITPRGGSSARLRPGRAAGKTGDTTTTGADGTFRIDGLSGGQHVVSVVSGPGTAVSVNATPGDKDVVLRVQLQGVIAGKVIDAATGEPVTRFSFTVSRGPRPAQTSPAAARRVADPNGAFSAMGVAPGRHHVVVQAPGYAIGIAGPIETGLGERVSGVVVSLERGIIVHGRVVDGSGKPIPGARVAIIEEVQMAASASHPGIVPQRRINALRGATTTFADGSYLLPNVGKGSFHLAVGNPPEHIITETDSFTLTGGEGTIELSDAVLVRAASVTGIVLNGRGRPDHSAVVTAFPDGRVRGGLTLPASTDASGRYRLQGLHPGTWRIAVTVSEGRAKLNARISSSGRTVTLDPGATANVDFRD